MILYSTGTGTVTVFHTVHSTGTGTVRLRYSIGVADCTVQAGSDEETKIVLCFSRFLIGLF